jgi:hypothetical protein
MRVAIFDRVEPPVPAELPFRLVANCSQRAAAAMLVLAVPFVIAIGFATVMLILHALFAPTARAAVAQHPALGLEILAAVAIWTYFLGWPLKRLFDRLSVSRTIEIDAAAVIVIERSYFRSRSWAMPLASFSGVAHHVRASLSGTRHELILVHPDRDRSVLLSLAAKVPQAEVDRVCALLGHKEVSPGVLYRFRAPISRIHLPAWRNPAHA